MAIDRSTVSYLLLHYLVLLSIIFSLITALELAGVDIALWFGIVLAIIVGVAYPRIVRNLDVAPEQWEQ